MFWPFRALSRRSSREVLAPLPSPYAMFVSLTFVLATVVGCGSENYAAPEQTKGNPVFVGAGDIADCETSGDEATAELIANIDGTVFTLGDNAYPRGSAANFADCYEPTWGREKHRTKPVPAITTMWRQQRGDTSTTSEVPPAIQAKATTATTSASGTSSPSIAIARRSAVVMPPQRKSDG